MGQITIESNAYYDDVESSPSGYNQFDINFIDNDGSTLCVTIPIDLVVQLKNQLIDFTDDTKREFR